MKASQIVITGFLAASAAFFGVASAKGPDCESGPGMKHGELHGGLLDFGPRVERRLDRFKTELKLTAQQEPLWQAFAEKSKAGVEKTRAAMRERVKDEKPLSAPDRLARVQNGMKDRLTAMESVHESFKRLYDALSPEQKAVADQHFARGGHRHPEARHHGKGHPEANKS